MKEETNAGIVLGIMGIVFDIISLIVCWWLSIVGIFLGFISIFFPKRACGLIAIIFGIVSLVINIVVLSAAGIF